MKYKKTMHIFIILILVLVLLYIFAWVSSKKEYTVEFGISFSQIYAESLDLDWKETYLAMLTELKPKYVRIAAMWSEIEKEKGEYDFADVDWMMDKADESNTKVALVVGQKAPRWPECYIPEWASKLKTQDYQKNLLNYIESVVERYKDSEALELWQVENEPFIRFRFGECEGFDKQAVYKEIDLVRQLDPNREVMVTDSGELSTWRRASRTGDILGTTLYRIVRTPRGGIFTYDWLPPAVYRWKAGFWNKSMDNVYVSELQAEPWFDNGTVTTTPLSVQKETMDLQRFQEHLDYTRKIGSPRAYLWGVEWWYWMKEVGGDEGFWEVVRNLSSRFQAHEVTRTARSGRLNPDVPAASYPQSR